MSRMIEGLTGFKNFMAPQSNTWMENADETDEEELKEFCEFMEEECNAEFIEEINQESINTMIDYSAFPSVSNSVSKGSATLLSSFEKRKVKKKRKQKITPLKNLKSIIVENPRLVSPTKSTPPSSPFHPQSCTFEYIPHDVVGEYESIYITPSNYPSNLTHVSSCQIKQTSRFFLFGSSVTNRNVSTHLISFTVEPSCHPNTNLKKQHLEKFPKDVLPSFGSDSRIMMVVNTYLESYYLFIYSKDTFYNAQVDSNGNLLSPFRKCEFTKTNEATEFFTMISKYKDSEIWRFGGRNKKTNELTNELEVFSTIDKKHIKIEKIIPKSSKIPAPRQDHCMYYDSKKERIFIFGGVDKNGNLLNDLQCFDMENKTWREIKTNFKLPPLKNCKLTMNGYKLDRILQLIGGNFSDGSVNSLIISIYPETGDVKVHSALE
ncbi:predicted protein [Naegleria gruberi]|uniref:Predicted protein n=1 Tax=Naegleria gruberi TaxID=5762 RepID=D2V4F4_NAEGR|nr:uncharacterized protein NAEGRDRAFT_63706 [Naegleria gruberi]EFC48376.1 predicted protein [Naegleria gruberi]|eukprot:XP_002681120.1 predicted protein [Naegleria gruberi strain NEG-M]